jgi:hypothetical protein
VTLAAFGIRAGVLALAGIALAAGLIALGTVSLPRTRTTARSG